MNQIRTALSDVREAVDVPTPDRVALGVRVCAARRRRTTGRLLVGVAAAAVAGTVALSLPGLGGGDRATPGPATQAPRTGDLPLSAPVWFVQDGRLTALDPAGETHRLAAVESVVGWTSERVWAIGAEDGRLVEVESRWDAERQELSVGFATAPTGDPVGAAVLSGDGRYLAWQADGVVTVRDEKADREQTYEAAPNTAVVAVGAAGVLLSEDGDLVLRDGDAAIAVPTTGDGYGVASQLAQDLVMVVDRDDTSRLYDVSGGSAALLETLPGTAELGPYGERLAVLTGDPVDLRVLEVGPGGSGVRVQGLDGIVPDQVRWAGETTLLVSGRDTADVPGLYACDIEMVCRQLPVDGEAGLQ